MIKSVTITPIRWDILYLALIGCVTFLGLGFTFDVFASSEVFAAYQTGLGGIILALYSADLNGDDGKFRITAALLTLLSLANLAGAHFVGIEVSGDTVSGFAGLLTLAMARKLALSGIGN